MSTKKHDIKKEIPYGQKLVIKERSFNEAIEDINQKFDNHIETGEEGYITIGFENPEKIRKILTPKRRELMKAIMVAEPESITKLAEITDRGITEVSRDLKILENNRIVYFEEEGEGMPKKPVVPYSEIEINYDLKSSLMNQETKIDFETA